MKDHTGGCQCGARPPEWPNVSARKMKAWHRTHKAEVRLWLERPASTISTDERQEAHPPA